MRSTCDKSTGCHCIFHEPFLRHFGFQIPEFPVGNQVTSRECRNGSLEQISRFCVFPHRPSRATLATTVTKGIDRSIGWHRPFTIRKFASVNPGSKKSSTAPRFSLRTDQPTSLVFFSFLVDFHRDRGVE